MNEVHVEVDSKMIMLHGVVSFKAHSGSKFGLVRACLAVCSVMCLSTADHKISVGGTLVKEVETFEERVLEMMQQMVVGMAGHTHLPVAMENLGPPQYPVLLLNQSNPRSFQGSLQLCTLPSRMYDIICIVPVYSCKAQARAHCCTPK